MTRCGPIFGCAAFCGFKQLSRKKESVQDIKPKFCVFQGVRAVHIYILFNTFACNKSGRMKNGKERFAVCLAMCVRSRARCLERIRAYKRRLLSALPGARKILRFSDAADAELRLHAVCDAGTKSARCRCKSGEKAMLLQPDEKSARMCAPRTRMCLPKRRSIRRRHWSIIMTVHSCATLPRMKTG